MFPSVRLGAIQRLPARAFSTASGRIELIGGPMFSGKTTELFRRLHRHERAGRRVVLIKHAKDTRYSSSAEAVSHDKQRFSAIPASLLTPLVSPTAPPDASPSLLAARAQISSACVVGIDEGQFFPDLSDASDALANSGKTVVIAALDGDFRRCPFPSVAATAARAESVTKLLAVCRKCGADAPFSARTGGGNEQVVIGGEEMYMAACRGCHAQASFAGDASAAGTTTAAATTTTAGEGAASVKGAV